MKIKLLSLSLASGLLAGCATQQAKYVDPNRTDALLKTTDKINIQEWAMAANDMVASLVDSGKIQTPGDKPAILVVSRIINGTTEHIDQDLLTEKILIALNKGGKIIAESTDAKAKALRAENDFINNTKVSRNPDYTLSGKIIEDRTRSGSTRQVAYVFQLTLNSADGLAVWKDEKMIVKQGNRPNVGW